MISEQIRMTLMRISPLLDTRLAAQLRARWDELAKPHGGLGRLEEMVVHFGLVRGTPSPTLQRKGLYLFCADHGVAVEGVSGVRADYTRQMVKTLLRGGAAVNALCRQHRIELIAVDMGLRGPKEPGMVDCRIAEGSASLSRGPAMSVEQTNRAIETGISQAGEAAGRFEVAGLGDVGAGNTTAAAALVSALTGLDAAQTVGPGSMAGDIGLARKMSAVRGALMRNRDEVMTAYGALRCLGGFEIGAMVGFLIGAATRRLPVMVDGYTACAAALVARGLAPDCLDAALFSHLSSDPAHATLVGYLGVTPYLNLGLRMGEGTGAALALGVLDSALALYREISVAADAGLSPGSSAALQ